MKAKKRAELLYAAGEDLWLAADKLHWAKHRLREAEAIPATRSRVDDLLRWTEGVAQEVELSAKALMEEVHG